MTNEKPLKMNESQGEELVERDDDAIEILDTDTPTVPFKFSKKATTDDIVNIDADLIDIIYYLLFIIYYLLFIIYYLLFIIYYLLFIIYYLLFIIYYLLFIIYYLLFIIYYLLFIIYYLLFIIYYLLFITALASATGEKDTPRRRGTKPPDSIEQGAKPPVR